MLSVSPKPINELRLQRFARNVARWAMQEASRQQDLANFEVDAYDLTGMCAIAAVRAHALLVRAGFCDAKLALSARWMECHAFVVVAGCIVDPTAMQFKKDGPLVQGHPARKSPWYYKNAKLFADATAFCAHLDATEWCWGQHPRRSLQMCGRRLAQDVSPPKASPVLHMENEADCEAGVVAKTARSIF